MKNEIACVILNYNNHKDTIKCVDNILKMNCMVDIVIPDNNSRNDSFRVLENKYKDEENVFVIRNKINAGYSAGNNFGIKYILNKNDSINYICIMNPDTLFDDAKLLDRMKAKMEEHKDIAVIAPVMYLRGECSLERSCWNLPSNIDFLRRMSIYYRWKEDVNLEYIDEKLAYVDVLHGSFFMIRRDVLEQIDYLDENIFLYSEENALGFKVKNIGMREAICIDERYYHNHPVKKERLSLKKKMSSARIGFNSRLYICKQYYPKYLYPIARIKKTISMGSIVLRHTVGSIMKNNREK